MSHHSGDGNDDAMHERMRAFFDNGAKAQAKVDELTKLQRPGPTGAFPNGKLTPSDEGQIGIAIAHVDGRVVIDFGKPVAWLGMLPNEARDVARTMLKHADAIDGKDGE